MKKEKEKYDQDANKKKTCKSKQKMVQIIV